MNQPARASTGGVDAAVGAALARLRSESHLTLQDIASAMAARYGHRWTRGTVSAIESGRRNVSLTELADLARLFECSLSALLPVDDLINAMDSGRSLTDWQAETWLRIIALRSPLRDAEREAARVDDLRLLTAAAQLREVTESPNALRRVETVTREAQLAAMLDNVTAAVTNKWWWLFEKAEVNPADWLGARRPPEPADLRRMVSAAAIELFGRDLLEEREARLDSSADQMSERGLSAARGHATRAIAGEVFGHLIATQTDPEGEK